MKFLWTTLVIIVITSQLACKQTDKTFELTNSGDTTLAFTTTSNTFAVILVKVKGTTTTDVYLDHVFIPKGTIDTLLRFEQYTNNVALKFKNPSKGENKLIITCNVP